MIRSKSAGPCPGPTTPPTPRRRPSWLHGPGSRRAPSPAVSPLSRHRPPVRGAARQPRPDRHRRLRPPPQRNRQHHCRSPERLCRSSPRRRLPAPPVFEDPRLPRRIRFCPLRIGPLHPPSHLPGTGGTPPRSGCTGRWGKDGRVSSEMPRGKPVLDVLETCDPDVLLFAGAGDLDQWIPRAIDRLSASTSTRETTPQP